MTISDLLNNVYFVDYMLHEYDLNLNDLVFLDIDSLLDYYDEWKDIGYYDYEVIP